MFTIDSKKGLEVIEGFECSLRLLSILHKITWDPDVRTLALRMLNGVNEYMPGRMTVENEPDD